MLASMSDFLLALLSLIKSHTPEIAIFASLAIGHFVGKFKIGPAQLGGVCGTLVTAILIGQLGFNINPGVKNFFFALFIFALGYASGPQFFANINLKGLRMWLLPLIEFFSVMGLVLLSVKLFGFDAGTAAGLMAGSATESAVIGTAAEAIGRLPFAAKEISTMQANIVTAYSITYIFGLITIVIFTSQIAPILLRINLRAEAVKMWEAMGGGADASGTSGGQEATPEITGRVFQVTNGKNKKISDIEKILGQGVSIELALRMGKEIQITPELTLKQGDALLIEGHRAGMLHASDIIGPEIAQASNLNMVMESDNYIVQNRSIFKKKLKNLHSLFEEKSGKHPEVFISGITRSGHPLPVLPEVTLEQGDIIHLYGPSGKIAPVGALIGRHVASGEKTNFVYVGIGLVVGICIGLLGFNAGGVMISLGTGGGALLAGLVFGWFQNKHPAISGMPPSAVELAKDLGLSTFVACVGLSAGPQAIEMVGQYGIMLPLLGMCIVLIPASISLVVGHFILRIEAPVLIGAIAGQQCSTPAVSAVQAAAGNTTPILGYTITYAVSNVLLPLLGPIVVALIHMMG